MFSPEGKVILSCSVCQGFHLKEFLHLICHNKAVMFSLKKLEREQEKKNCDQVILKSSKVQVHYCKLIFLFHQFPSNEGILICSVDEGTFFLLTAITQLMIMIIVGRCYNYKD